MTRPEPKVYFIGAGPGDPDLLTIKGRDIIAAADLVLYAGSLVPREVVAHAGPGARVADSQTMTLEETHALMAGCVRRGGVCARVHTGDPSLFGAVAEQARLLDAEAVPHETVPGVTAAFAAAAAASTSLTVPGVTQTLVLTRLAGRTPVPERERLRDLAAHRSAMAVYLSGADPETLQAELLAGGHAPHTLVVIAHKVGWPGESLTPVPLIELAATARRMDAERQTVFLVLPGARAETRSCLYHPGFGHRGRPGPDQD
jgi:precorrin-4/cobalt-precorrin-4 C11-methyltransferase